MSDSNFRFSEKQLDIIYEICPEFKYVDDGVYIPHLEYIYEDGVTLRLFYCTDLILMLLYEPKKPGIKLNNEIEGSKVMFEDFGKFIDYLKG